eukprot:g3554.t1
MMKGAASVLLVVTCAIGIAQFIRYRQRIVPEERTVPEERKGKETYYRDFLAHQILNVPYAKKFPRVDVKALKRNVTSDAFWFGRRPFVISGGMNRWPAMDVWRDGHYLAKTWPREVTDYFPFNMLDTKSKALYLFRLEAGIRDLIQDRSTFKEANEEHSFHPGRYLHWQVVPKIWNTMRKSGMVSPFPRWMKTDQWWMRHCLKTEELQDEYHIKTHWRVILLGTRGSGMFNHSDSLRSSSWHAHVSGSKWWYVCRDETCYEELLQEGDILYYPRDWYHQTQCVPSNDSVTTITLTGTVVNAYNYRELAAQLRRECVFGSLNFEFSGALCDALQSCVVLWDERFGAQYKDKFHLWSTSWRSAAPAKVIRKKDAPSARGNNYDGRNHIAG